MNVLFVTPTVEYAKEVGDVISLFFGRINYLINMPSQDAEIQLIHTESVHNDVRFCSVVLSGFYLGETSLQEKIHQDALLEKRMHKRQVKLAVYNVLVQSTGIRPPWGSLTGIRPTRLVYEQMQQGLPLEEALLSVEETFDVSRGKMDLLRDIIQVQQGFPAPQDNETDIYIGIPFCVSRCYYCSFLSGEVGKGELLEPYVQALLAEMDRVAVLIREKGFSIRTFYMGGGTPTALPLPLFRKVLEASKGLITMAKEATVEAGRPDTLDMDKLSVIRDAGASRISINPQTMHDTTLRIIGRNHTRKQTEEAYDLARRAGFHHINMDLIAGLPTEKEEQFAQTLEWSHTLRPESLTIHTLSVTRSSKMHLDQDELPDGNMVSAMVDMGRKSAETRGMLPYYLYRQKHQAGNLENVGYALPGHACLYNIDMMEDVCSVLALGAGGISKRVWPGRKRIVRAPNVKEVSQYITRVDEMAQRKRDMWVINE